MNEINYIVTSKAANLNVAISLLKSASRQNEHSIIPKREKDLRNIASERAGIESDFHRHPVIQMNKK